jgi:hypothetical protein
MRKFLFMFIALISLALQQMNAQVIVQDKTTTRGGGGSLASGDIQFGVKAGLNISSFLNRDNIDYRPKPGAYLGGMAEIPFSDEIYFQPEAIISFQGGDIGPGDLNLVYLHLPLMGKYHFTESFAAEFGPQIGFVLDSNSSNFGGITTAQLETNTVQFALNFGGGYRMDENFYFQARFSLGLTKTIKDSSLRNGIFQIGACYFFL